MIVEDIQRLKSQFRVCEFHFVRRSANSVANNLAGYGLRGSGVKTWEWEAPDGLLFSPGKDNQPH